MTTENKALLLKIVTASNNVTVSFNVPVDGNYSNINEIIIHECNAALIHDLENAGFSLHLSKKGLTVDKYS